MCGGGQKQSSKSTYTPDPQAKAFYSDVLTGAKSALSPYDPATEKQVAGLTPEQMQAFGGIGAMQGQYQPYVDEATGMTRDAGAAIGAGDIERYMNPFQDQALNAILQRIGEQDAMQRRQYTANEAAQGGLGGSGYHLGKADLMGEQTDARNATIADMLFRGWNTALGAAQTDKTRGLQAGQQMAGLGQLNSALGYQDTAQLLGAGNQQQAQRQAELDAASTNALNEQLYPMQQQQWLASIGSGIGPLMGGTTKGTAKAESGKGIGNVLGGALTLAGMASDERVKENAVQIGETFDGQPIYKFNYRGDPRSQIGLMAQDVEQERPGAVRELGGVKHVNYDEALEGSEGFADGGGIQSRGGLLPWAEIRPSNPIVPQAPSIAPQKEGEGQDFEQMYNMGKKAGAGLESLFGSASAALPAASSPAGGALAASGLQGYGSSGGLGGLGSLFSMFGFADGGLVATPEEMNALEMVESGGRNIQGPVTRSGERAQGPRQIMPSTARDPGFGVTPLREGASVEEQRRFSDDYFNAMLRRYKGDREAARIAYNGGPARADAWLKAGRDDSVIPRESADYYKKIQRQLTPGTAMVGEAKRRVTTGTDGGSTAPLVQKGFTASRAEGEPYRGAKDKATGGFLKSMFGVEFNPLGLTENERKALIVAGLSMMSHGDIGRGGLTGMQYLTGVEAGERDARAEAAKLSAQLKKDADELALKTRAEDRMTAKDKADVEQFNTKEKREAAQYTRTQDFAEKKPTDDMREYQEYSRQELAAGRQPSTFLDYQLQIKKAGKPETNVTVSGEKKGMEEMAKLFAKRYDDVQRGADGAQTMIDNLEQLEAALDTGVRTGTAAEAEQGLRKIGVMMGVGDADKVAAGELIQAIGNKLALQVRAPGGESGGMPGAMSDADREFLKQTVASLGKTEAGNRQLIGVLRAVATRNLAISDMAIDYAAEKGQLDAGFDRQVRDYVRANPLRKTIEAETAKRVQDKPASVKTETVAPPRVYQPKAGVPRWSDPDFEPDMIVPPPGAPPGFKILGVQ